MAENRKRPDAGGSSKTCPVCWKQVPLYEQRCPHCGYSGGDPRRYMEQMKRREAERAEKKSQSGGESEWDFKKIGIAAAALILVLVLVFPVRGAIARGRNAPAAEEEEQSQDAEKKQDTVISAEEKNRINAEKAKELEEAIDSIGEVTFEKYTIVQNVHNMYMKSGSAVRALVRNADVLENADRTMARLLIEHFKELVNSIGEVTIDSKSKIEEADRYILLIPLGDRDEISGEIERLKKIKSEYEDVALKYKEQQVKDVLAGFTREYDKVIDGTFYMPKEFPRYINERSYILPYINASSMYPQACSLRLVINYAGERWIFWDSVNIYVDGRNYYKNYSYSSITRDNNRGVWEYVDVLASESDIEMLKAIANSNETIVRFEGDDRQYDLTVKASDKSAIRQTLEAYEKLKAMK